ncbi:MAG: outer membrane protein assembly factor BamB [Steroidobacteraceae bacterium]
MNWSKLTLMAMSGLVLAACDNSKAVDPPAELVDIKPVLQIKQLWSDSLGGDAKRLRLGLQPAIVNGVAYAASHDGDVLALTADHGKRLWRVKTKLELSAGPAVAEGLVVVGSSNGELVALEADSGKQRWRHQLSGEMLSKALVGKGMVIARTVDGRLQALNASDGSPRWNFEETVPKLSLRGTAVPILAGDTVIAGFDNGKLVALDINNGDILWNVTIDSPAGRTELDRLADIDAPAAVAGRDVFVAGFQGRVAMLDLDNGQIWWAKDASSYRGFGLDERMLYLTNANGLITAMRRTDGNQQWEQASLRQRSLTAPAVAGDSLVVGDYEGYVHWLSAADGSVQARAKTDGERITNTPVVADGRVYVQTDGGKLIAFETKPKG